MYYRNVLYLTSDLAPTAKNCDTEAHPELAKSNNSNNAADSDSEAKKLSTVKLGSAGLVVPPVVIPKKPKEPKEEGAATTEEVWNL